MNIEQQRTQQQQRPGLVQGAEQHRNLHQQGSNAEHDLDDYKEKLLLV